MIPMIGLRYDTYDYEDDDYDSMYSDDYDGRISLHIILSMMIWYDNEYDYMIVWSMDDHIYIYTNDDVLTIDTVVTYCTIQ